MKDIINHYVSTDINMHTFNCFYDIDKQLNYRPWISIEIQGFAIAAKYLEENRRVKTFCRLF